MDRTRSKSPRHVKWQCAVCAARNTGSLNACEFCGAVRRKRAPVTFSEEDYDSLEHDDGTSTRCGILPRRTTSGRAILRRTSRSRSARSRRRSPGKGDDLQRSGARQEGAAILMKMRFTSALTARRPFVLGACSSLTRAATTCARAAGKGRARRQLARDARGVLDVVLRGRDGTTTSAMATMTKDTGHPMGRIGLPFGAHRRAHPGKGLLEPRDVRERERCRLGDLGLPKARRATSRRSPVTLLLNSRYFMIQIILLVFFLL